MGVEPEKSSAPGAGRTRIAIMLPGLFGGGAERVMLKITGTFLAAGGKVDIVLQRARGELLDPMPEEARLFDLDCERLTAVPLAFARHLRRVLEANLASDDESVSQMEPLERLPTGRPPARGAS